MTRPGLLVLAGLLAGMLHPGAAAAQEGGEPVDRASPLVTYTGRVEWIGAVRWTEPADVPVNPGNRRLRMPQLAMHAEVRPHLQIDLGTRVTAVARPRGTASVQSAWTEGAARTDTRDASANWTELYLLWRAGDAVQVSYGLQNFGWGPAELLAPSNRIFHETGLFRDQLYYVRGRHLLRVNLSAGRSWSAVGLAELGDNGEDPFLAREPFRRQGQIKLEYSAPSGQGYVGATYGARAEARPWFGEYASIALTEGWSAYFDGAHTRGSRAWYPVRLPHGNAVFARRDVDARGWRTLAVAGLRYTLAAGPDARVEYVHQDSGYSDAEFRLAAEAAAAAFSPDAFAPYLAPGLEFVGRRLLLLSLRLPDLPPRKHLALHGRYLRSITDRSGVAFLTASLEAAGALIVFASTSLSHGEPVAEFSRLARATAVLGMVWTW